MSKLSQDVKSGRYAKVMAAAADERSRFNAKVLGGAKAILPTGFGQFFVNSVSDDWWYHCTPVNSGEKRSFCGCNDGKWADLLRQVGEPRNALWA